MNLRNGQTSNLIQTVAIITEICFIIIGLIIGYLCGLPAMSTSSSGARGLAVILGMALVQSPGLSLQRRFLPC